MSRCAPRAVAPRRPQREHDVHHGGVAAGADVGDLRLRDGRRAVRAVGHRQKAGVGAIVEVVARHGGARPILPVAGNRTIDEPRVYLPRVFPPEAEAHHDAGAELFDEDIGAFDQRPQPRRRAGSLEVDLDALLAAVEHGEQQAVIAGARASFAHGLAAGALDLDHLGARLGEDEGGERPRQEGGEIEHADIGERRHGCLPAGALPYTATVARLYSRALPCGTMRSDP